MDGWMDGWIDERVNATLTVADTGVDTGGMSPPPHCLRIKFNPSQEESKNWIFPAQFRSPLGRNITFEFQCTLLLFKMVMLWHHEPINCKKSAGSVLTGSSVSLPCNTNNCKAFMENLWPEDRTIHLHAHKHGHSNDNTELTIVTHPCKYVVQLRNLYSKRFLKISKLSWLPEGYLPLVVYVTSISWQTWLVCA